MRGDLDVGLLAGVGAPHGERARAARAWLARARRLPAATPRCITMKLDTVSGSPRGIATSWRMIPVLKNSSRTSIEAARCAGSTASPAPPRASDSRSGLLPRETFFFTMSRRGS